MCVVYRLGCMTPGKLNYDQYATVEDFCYTQLSGCLDTRALNVGCKVPGLVGCPDGLVDQSPDQITHHEALTCTFYYSPPPSPPLPRFPPDTRIEDKKFAAKTELTVATQPTVAVLNTVKQTVGSGLTCYGEGKCEIDVTSSPTEVGVETRRKLQTSAYLIVVLVTSAEESVAAAAAVELIAGTSGSIEEASAFTGVEVIAIPSVVETTVYTVIPAPNPPPPAAPPPDDDLPVGAIVGGVVGGVFGCCMIGVIVYMLMKKKKGVTPAY
jgi:hypothetical protein